MSKILTGIFFILFGLLPSAFAAVESIREIDLITVPSAFQSSLKVARLIGSETKWSDENVLAELNKANAIYAQCGVQFKKIYLMDFDLPGDIMSDYERDEVAIELYQARFRKHRELVLVLAAQMRIPSAGVAFHENRESSDPARLANTAFVLEMALTDEYRSHRDPNYSPLAHELGHLLLSSGHVPESNLMGDRYDLVNDKLTPQQCRKIKESPLLTSVQKRLRNR
jgi:hypothetical protein